MTTSAHGTCAVPRDQITGVLEGQIVPITNSPVLTSASTPWSGFLLETYSAQVVRQEAKWGWNKAHLCLVTNGSIQFRVRRSGVSESFLGETGSVYVFPAGFEEYASRMPIRIFG